MTERVKHFIQMSILAKYSGKESKWIVIIINYLLYFNSYIVTLNKFPIIKKIQIQMTETYMNYVIVLRVVTFKPISDGIKVGEFC